MEIRHVARAKDLSLTLQRVRAFEPDVLRNTAPLISNWFDKERLLFAHYVSAATVVEAW